MTDARLHMSVLSRSAYVRSDEGRFLSAIREAFPHLEASPRPEASSRPETPAERGAPPRSDTASLPAFGNSDTPRTLAYRYTVDRKSDLFVDSLGTPIAHSQDFNLYHWKKSFVVSAGVRSFAQCFWEDARVEVTVHPDDREDDWVVAHRLFFLPLLEWMRREGYYPLHASGFEVAGKTILVSGPSGSGKSTSSLAALAAGAPFLTDDTLFVSRDREGKLVLNPFPEPIKIGRESARWFPRWREDFVERHGKFSLPDSRLPGGGRMANCSPGLLLFPSFSREKVTRFEPMARPEAMVRLLPQSAIPSTSDVLQSHMDLLGDFVEASDPYFFRFAEDVPDLMTHLDRLVRSKERSN
ncbi:MAG: hypothetical protein HKN20_07890 [Gemmatimonadetes bacterium]|nr:hypothetical protein [Gemmatimonadota bacterium]